MNVLINLFIRLLKNPINIWILWFIKSQILIIKNRKRHLDIKYNARLINCNFGNYNTFYEQSSVYNSSLGNYVYIAKGTTINNTIIGNFCSIGPDCKIGLGIHPTEYISTYPSFFSIAKQNQISFVKENYFEEYKNIQIGNDVWIGANVIILDGITIKNGAIVAAGSVVTRDVESFTIVAGVPAKLIKKRFDNQTIEQIIETNWWDRDIQWIKENAQYFKSPDIFLKVYLENKYLKSLFDRDE